MQTQGAGYRAEIGFHQLLYPNENDTRKLFIWFAQAGSRNKPMNEGPMVSDSGLIGESIIKVCLGNRGTMRMRF
jgi:hypothetical protein